MHFYSTSPSSDSFSAPLLNIDVEAKDLSLFIHHNFSTCQGQPHLPNIWVTNNLHEISGWPRVFSLVSAFTCNYDILLLWLISYPSVLWPISQESYPPWQCGWYKGVPYLFNCSSSPTKPTINLIKSDTFSRHATQFIIPKST